MALLFHEISEAASIYPTEYKEITHLATVATEESGEVHSPSLGAPPGPYFAAAWPPPNQERTMANFFDTDAAQAAD
eukprot:291753-Pyramimonas_sp.AAC.1